MPAILFSGSVICELSYCSHISELVSILVKILLIITFTGTIYYLLKIYDSIIIYKISHTKTDKKHPKIEILPRVVKMW